MEELSRLFQQYCALHPQRSAEIIAFLGGVDLDDLYRLPALSDESPPKHGRAPPRGTSKQPLTEIKDENKERINVVPSGPPSTPKTAPAPKKAAAAAAGTPSGIRAFRAKRDELARSYYASFNARVFSGRLPRDLPIIWSSRLQTTGGRAFARPVRVALGEQLPPACRTIDSRVYAMHIELAHHVIDTPDRLAHVLLHEMCHIAVYYIDGTVKAPAHGSEFKRWGRLGTAKYPHLEVKRCHNFKIRAKYVYKCQNCGLRVGRQSKSIDTETHVCGRCDGKLLLLQGPKQGRPATGFSAFVKEHYARTAAELGNPGAPAVMRALACKWKDERPTAVQDVDGTPLRSLGAAWDETSCATDGSYEIATEKAGLDGGYV